MSIHSQRFRSLFVVVPALLLGILLAACQPIQPTTAGSTVPSGGTVPAQPPPTPVIPAEGEVLSMWVEPERQTCMGVVEMQCLQVKWSEDGAWENFFSSIDGFIHVPGYNYELLVRRFRVDPTPADASSIAWTLDEIVSRTPDFSGDPLPLAGTQWHLVSFGEHEMVVFDPATIEVTAQFGDSSVAGRAGCNRYTTAWTRDGSTLTISDAMAMTRMMCDEAAMAVEMAFTTAFVGEHQFQINGDKLEIIYAAGELIFQGTAAE